MEIVLVMVYISIVVLIAKRRTKYAKQHNSKPDRT